MTNLSNHPPLLSLLDITKTFGTGENAVQVLKGISLTVHTGEMVAIIGQSGSGKSTLMNIMACLDTPTSGDYHLDGADVSKMNQDQLAILRRDKFGFIFQRYQLLSGVNATDNVAMPAIYAGQGKAFRQKKAKELLAKLGLGERTSHYPNQLSGGQQQRVSIARALMNGGQVIFADEPTGALDSQSSRDVMEILISLNQEGHTVILVTHDPKVAQVANRIIEIGDGKILSDEPNKQRLISNNPPKTTQEPAPKTALQDKDQEPAQATASQNLAQEIHPKTTKPAQDPTAPTVGTPTKPKVSRFASLNRLKEAFRMAMLTMVANKMRTLLTMLGIIIGIASVVLIVALGNGSKQKILDEINSVGAVTITVSAGSEDGDKQASNVDTLTLDDMYVLQEQKFVASASPDLSMPMVAQVGNSEKNITVDGVDIHHHRLKNVSFIEGSMFSQSDLADFNQVIVISDKTKQAFFPKKSALGEVIFMNGVPNRVIGVFKYNGVEGSFDRSLKVWLPYRTYQIRFAGDTLRLSSITILLKKDYPSALASENITKILTKRHGTKDFTLFNSDSLAKTVEKTAKSLTLLIGAIAVISLLVGGIGVMNIMLVSVTERTGEIGVRMAVGATYKDIVQQFLIEAMVVCAIGGVIGVMLAFGLGLLVQLFDIKVVFSPTSIVMAVGCASLIGLVFGFMPAHRAAKMNPIDALNKG